VGLFSTLMLVATVLAYSIVKFVHLMNKHNPTISESTALDAYTKADAINLGENNLVFAFNVKSFYGRKELNDTNLVAWQPMLVEADGQVNEKFTYLEHRKCIEEDW
jgi:hypothetical protein